MELAENVSRQSASMENIRCDFLAKACIYTGQEIYLEVAQYGRWGRKPCSLCMMTSSNGTIFRVTGPLCGELTGPGDFPHKGQWHGALMFSLICAWIDDLVNNREAGDLRRHRGHYVVNVMVINAVGMFAWLYNGVNSIGMRIGYSKTVPWPYFFNEVA